MWNRILDACATASAAIIGALAVLVSYDVLARNVGLWSPSWIVDITEFALPLATLLIAPWLAAREQHIRIDLAAMVLRARTIRRLDGIVYLGCALVCAVIAYYGVNVTIESYTTGARVIKSIVFPEWWVFAPIPVAFAALAIECLRCAAKRRLPYPGESADAGGAPAEKRV